MTKIIFSRKGFDSSAGGVPSPIIKDEPLSIPIPYHRNTNLTYNDIGLGQMVSDLTNNKISVNSTCHVDPFIETQAGLFGQAGAAQSHLENNNVEVGDLFLFWGWFRQTNYFNGKYTYSKKDPGHYRIFGWLQIGEIIKLGEDPSTYLKKEKRKFHNHPHTTGHWTKNNTLYIAKKKLNVFGIKDWQGHGKFKSSPKTNLSANPFIKKSEWNCPDWLNPHKKGCGMTYHNDLNRWKNSTVQIVGRGQEFIAVPSKKKECKSWLKNIFEDALSIEEITKRLFEAVNEEVLRRAYERKDEWIPKFTIH